MWEQWVIDAGMSYPDGVFCFVPVEGDIRSDDCSIVFGMNLLSTEPPEGRVVGLIHSDGQEAADAFYEANKEAIDKLLHPPQAANPVTRDDKGGFNG